MNQIIAILGKSSSGKDTLCHSLIERYGFLPVIPYTTRPRRPGEHDGVDYHFVTVEKFRQMLDSGEFIEFRTYNTLLDNKPDTWYYGTARTDLDPARGNYAVVVDLAALASLRREFGSALTSIFLQSPEPLRRARCMARGDFSAPEWERREADDHAKYADEVLKNQVDYIIDSTDKESCDAAAIEIIARKK